MRTGWSSEHSFIMERDTSMAPAMHDVSYPRLAHTNLRHEIALYNTGYIARTKVRRHLAVI